VSSEVGRHDVAGGPPGREQPHLHGERVTRPVRAET
jgi:hypothetical protein